MRIAHYSIRNGVCPPYNDTKLLKTNGVNLPCEKYHLFLFRSTGMSQRTICKSRHMSLSSVSEVFRIAEEKHLTYADVESLSNRSSSKWTAVRRIFFCGSPFAISCPKKYGGDR